LSVCVDNEIYSLKRFLVLCYRQAGA